MHCASFGSRSQCSPNNSPTARHRGTRRSHSANWIMSRGATGLTNTPSGEPLFRRYTRNLEAAEPEHLSIFSVIAQESFYGEGVEHGIYRIESGTEQLPYALAEAIRQQGGQIRLNAVVEAVHQSETGVQALYRIWEETDTEAGDPGILSLWVGGEPARRWAGWDANQRIERCLQLLETMYPDCRSQLISAVSYAWSTDPFAQHAYIYHTPGYLTQALPTLRQPEGRLHFAGDYLSLFVGYMEGALESAERAVHALRTRYNSPNGSTHTR